MTDDRRDQLAEMFVGPAAKAWVDALMPTIDRMIREAQAEALETAASDWADDPDAVGDSEKDARNWLRDRAAALRADLSSEDAG